MALVAFHDKLTWARAPCMMQLLLLVFGHFFLVITPCRGRAVGPVASVNELLNALRDTSVDQIRLGSGVFSLDAVSGGLAIGPNRQLELVGSVDVVKAFSLAGTKWFQLSALQYASGIDFGKAAQGLFRLGDNTTLGFRNLFLWNGLSQLGYDWQVVTLAQPGARASVRFFQTVKLRDGCLPLQIFVQHVTSYTRLPDAAGQQQTASLQPFCYVPPAGAPPATTTSSTAAADAVTVSSSNSSSSGGGGNGSSSGSNVTCLAETLAIDNLATSITRSNGQSYSLYEQASSYWCRAYASMSCLSASGPEQCVKELLEANNNSNNSSSNGTAAPAAIAATAGSGEEGNSIVNILVPAIITGTLVLGFVFATVWCIRRRGAARGGSSLAAHPLGLGGAGDVEAGAGGGRGVGARVGDALSRLLPGTAAHRKQPHVPGFVPVVSKEALDRIAKVRAELSSKMVVASSSDDLSDVRNLHLVGKGTFGRVYKGEWKGVTVALKVISVPVGQYGQAQWQQVLGEAAISTLLNHPCVLQTYSVALLEYSPALKPASNASEDGVANVSGSNSGEQQPQQQPQTPAAAVAPASGAQLHDMAPFYQLKMVSEFCEGGSVVQALRRMQFYDAVAGGTVRMPAVIDIASQVASGMAYLHSANIIHADLKAANVLLKQQPGSGKLQAKVADFGLSFRLEEPEATHMTKGQLGSITHMAPEVLVQGRVSKSSDVYSFGILLYELYTGQQAYWDVPQPMLAYHVANAGGRPLLPSQCPAAYRGLAKACWASEPAARPTFEEVYKRLQALAGEAIRSVNNSPPNNRASVASEGGTADGDCDRPHPQQQHQQQQQQHPGGVTPGPAQQAVVGGGQLPSGAVAAAADASAGDTSASDQGRVAPPPSQEPTPPTAAGADASAAPCCLVSADEGSVGPCRLTAAAAAADPAYPLLAAAALPQPHHPPPLTSAAVAGPAATCSGGGAAASSDTAMTAADARNQGGGDMLPDEAISGSLVSAPLLTLVEQQPQ
ncbi:hypothetical protein PLESTB_000752900 [Pleodorina starrii]|uniref:Protein kinase domain-containing protein n=1 Tax=Pleodorina starrii TaxID=330485 RepID=A0A9W6BL92_9CHLO|nr:hypothetical protein PLESTM_001568200 [Pleodorina starrii]GLC53466.1 hypothetical protein PLESTB_000752900 [Pleodorina starrii]GLC69802.1 hypothetical protein PLESTF_000882100 [Pleodorina starrii]